MSKLAQYKQQLLNEFEARTDDWGYSDLERRLKELRKNTSYHDMKPIIIEAHKIGNWPNTVKRYLFTNHKAHGNVSSELTSAFNDVYFALSPEEKQFWNLGLK